MSKLLAVLLATVATQALAGVVAVSSSTMSIADAEKQVQKLPCDTVEVWEQPGQCARGQSDCTSLSNKDGAATILKGYKSDDYKAVIYSGNKSCSVLILEKNFSFDKPTTK
jgi:hypothetical protein